MTASSQNTAALPRFTAPLSIAALAQRPTPHFTLPAGRDTARWRFIAIDEINEEAPTAYRSAIANLFSAIDATMGIRLIYLLQGDAHGVRLYFGLEGVERGADLFEASRSLRATLEGQLPGVVFGPDEEQGRDALLRRFATARHCGLMVGVPTPSNDAAADQERDSQGIERLVRNLLASGHGDGSANRYPWQLALVAEPLAPTEIAALYEAALALCNQVALQVRANIQGGYNQNTQKTFGMSHSVTEGESTSKSENRSRSESGSTSKNWGKSASSGGSSSSSSTSSGESETKTVGTSVGQTSTTGKSSSLTAGESSSLARSYGGSLGISQEVVDKRAEDLLKQLEEELLPRLKLGRTKGLFRCALYLAAENRALYERLKRAARATFQGERATMSPLTVVDLPEGARTLTLPQAPKPTDSVTLAQYLFSSQSVGAHGQWGALWNTQELALVAGLPQRELPGVRRRKSVPFAVDLPDVPDANAVPLGPVIDMGRRYPMHPAKLNRNDLNKHLFVTGVTGAGKTTTCLKLLLAAQLPFLVIEPAKTEYRVLYQEVAELAIYRPNDDPMQSLRINPFALVRRNQRIKSHASFLKNVFAAIFPLEASMPQMVEAAILAAYEAKGWDLDENRWLGDDGDPFAPQSRAWPTMSEMIRELDRLIPTYKLGREFEEKYRGSLVSRLRGLTSGTLGEIVDVPESIDWLSLLERPTVIELEALQSAEEKALVMALVLGAINEAIRAKHEHNPAFRHLTLVEEAHRLLARPDPGERSRAMAIEAFADMLAEVRKYGEGLIIADQIPAKLIPDVIKNTHTKIVHRLFAEDDRRAMAAAMMMNEAQCDYLPNLATGEAILFCGGWHGPAHVHVENLRLSTSKAPLDHEGVRQLQEEQLWRERHRYYPHLTALLERWGEQEEPATESGSAHTVAQRGPCRTPSDFATFVQGCKQAARQLLVIVQALGEPAEAADSRADAPQLVRRIALLRDWLSKGHTLLGGTSDQAIRKMAELLFAFLRDGNPRPRAQAENPPPPLPHDAEGKEKFLRALILLFTEVAHAVTSWKEFHERIDALRTERELPNYLLNPLSHYETF